jgi:outer membrane protein assembly factor BamB
MKGTILIRSSIALAIVAAAVPPAWSQVNVLTHHNDNRRTGANLKETQLTVANVTQKFGKLWTLFADGQIVAQPLYVTGLKVDGKGTFNAVIVSTMHNTIYAYDADKKPTMPQSQDALIWAQWLGQPQAESFGFDSWNTNFPEYGIVSTPVINDAHTTMYVVSWHNNNGGQFRLHAIDLTKAPFPGPAFPPTDYRERIKPVPVITASVPKPGGGQIKLDVSQQKQRAALLLDNGVLYLGFSTNRETGGTLHGWLLAYDATTLTQKAVWNVTPTNINGGIWQAGSGPAAVASGNVYVMTGNGNFNANSGGKNFGDSFVKLKLEGTTLAVKDYFTPCNQKLLDRACGGPGRCDLDLGSAGPLLVPGTTPGSDLLIGGGKDGNIYVVDTSNMGHFKSPTGQVTMDCANPNAVQAIMGPQSQQGGQGVVGNIHGSHVLWQGPDVARVFVWGEEDILRSYEFQNGQLVTPPTKSLYQAPPGMPGGMLAISANGNTAGTGIVWALLPYAGDANQQRGVQAQLLAFDAQNIKNDIFRSSPPDDPAGPNSVGLFAKFAPPIVANGKVFVPTYGDHENPPGPIRYFEANGPPPGSIPKNFYVAVYGLKP